MPLNIVPPSRAAPSAPLLLREPYRLLFPLGFALSWAGVAPWVLFAFGAIEAWLPIFHAMTQVEGFLACIAAGFLLTMIPRRTATLPATAWEVAVIALAPCGATVLALFERWALAQVFWLLFLAVLARFAISRFRTRTAVQRVPASFVFVVFAIALGAVGAVLAGVGAANEDRGLFWLHEVGRDLVLQGVLSCLVIGVGTLIVPHVTRGDAPAELASARTTRVLYALCAIAFAGSFFVEQLVSRPFGFALRSLVTLIAFVPGARLWRPPSLPGVHRWLIWLSCWALPLGYALAALFPDYRKACLHVVFIGCFANIVFSVALHVVLTHAGRSEELTTRRGALLLLGTLLAAALFGRALVDLDRAHLRIWLGIAACSFLGATLVWITLCARSLAREP